jgi:undecaprenyl phosphate N,N'-diacetylbacillosamine 1-phosphate transferase
MYRLFFKRLIDLIVAILAFLLLSPVFFLAVIGLSVFNNGKPFFFQRRPGMHGDLFTIIKFKTMNDKRDEKDQLLPDVDRLTWVGNIVRKLSLDEIPQLLNVIKGEMSLVGPRPLLVEYLPLYTINQAKRHDVRPGITGWAQVNGRNTLSWVKKFEYDQWYVAHLSFGLDIKILFLTVVKIFKREGINSATSTTMEKFKGNKEL